MTARSASRRRVGEDVSLQIAAVRELASRMPAAVGPASTTPKRERTNPAIPPLGEEPEEEEFVGPTRRLFSDEDLQQRLAWAEGLRDEARVSVMRALKRAAELGSRRRLAVPGSSKGFETLRASFPHFRKVCDFVWRRSLLAGSVTDCGLRIPPLLLNGPPGVGKSEFAQRLAAWLGTPLTRVDMGALETSFRLTGLDCGYSTGRPGAVWDALQGPFMSPVVLLDEIDKRSVGTRDSGLAFLLALLEPSTASRFEDACVGLPLDASWINWIATSNDVTEMDAAVLSRFKVFTIPEPSDEESLAVVASVYAALRKREAWGRAFPQSLPHAVALRLVGLSAREMWQTMEEACATAVAQGRRDLHEADVPERSTENRRHASRIGFIA
jgi:ATP-dependent Lon protease